MAAEDRETRHPLIGALLAEGPQFSFFQAVRLLQQLHPDAAPVGHQGPPGRECVRFSQVLTLGFPTADVGGIEPDPTAPAGAERYRLEATFLGLYGGSSPLPNSYTEDLLWNDEDDGGLERRFYDLFQHRLLSLFYRAWERPRYGTQARPDGSDFYTRRLARMLHLAEGQVPRQHRTPRLRLLAFAGLLSQDPRSATCLLGVLEAAFEGVRFELEPFIERWLPIPADQQARLGQTGSTLGVDTHIGAALRDRGCTFRLTVRARDYPEFQRFLPGGALHAQLRELVDLFNTDLLDLDLELTLRSEDVPELRLGAPDTVLGGSTWLGEAPLGGGKVRFLCQGATHRGH